LFKTNIENIAYINTVNGGVDHVRKMKNKLNKWYKWDGGIRHGTETVEEKDGVNVRFISY
jgi:hypothetical protein